MYIVFHFWTGILRLSSDFSTQCFDKYELNSTFQYKFAEKVFLRYLPHAEPTQSYHFMV